RHRCLVGELRGSRGCRPRERLPHGDVDDDVWVERGDRGDDSVVVAGGDTLEYRPAQAISRRVDVDSLERTDPRFVLEQAGHAAAELAAHATHQHTYSACHGSQR